MHGAVPSARARRRIGGAALALIVFSGLVSARAGSVAAGREHPVVEAIFYNGTVRTMTGEEVVEAVAVGGDTIAAVGSAERLRRMAGPGTVWYDLRGKTVLPGFTDAHAHFYGFAKNLSRIDLKGTASYGEVLSRVSERIARTGRGRWIEGRGWDQNAWPDAAYPDRSQLDRIAPHHPVYLVRVCGHAAIVNAEALRLAGITGGTPDPPGGRIERGSNGEPTGLLFDEAMPLVSGIIPSPTREEKKALIRRAAGECLAAGLVGVHDMGVNAEVVSLYRELLAEGALPLRLTTYYDYDAPDLDSLLEAGPLSGHAADRLSVVGVKFYIDGSLGARSAALLTDYRDDPGNRGILVTAPTELAEKISACHRAGFQVAVHAIGDRGVRIVLDIFEQVLGRHPRSDTRHRIEHAQVVSPDDIPRFASIGIVPSMQFTHCTSDMGWAGERLGAERLAGAYAWRSLLASGCRIPGGSDFPVESIDPLLGVYAAVTRRDLDGNPEGGWFPEQCLTLNEALRAFTIDAAWAAHEEARRGSLAPGKLADFIVLSADPAAAEVRDIPRIEVLATIIGGRIEYCAEDFPLSQ